MLALKLKFIVIVSLLSFNSIVLCQRDIPTDNLSYPVLITLGDGTYGTGFFAADSEFVYLITSKHVLFKIPELLLKSETARCLKYSITDSAEGRFTFELNLKGLLEQGNLKYHDLQDMASINFGKRIKENGKTRIDISENITTKETSKVSLIGTDFSSFKKFKDVLIANEVIIFGFPRSIGIQQIPQLDYEKPLLRKGIVAGINHTQKTIIIDCPAYPGNSGGPVIEIDRVNAFQVKFKVIGIISEYVPFIEKRTNLISNSGYSVVVPIETVFEIVKK